MATVYLKNNGIQTVIASVALVGGTVYTLKTVIDKLLADLVTSGVIPSAAERKNIEREILPRTVKRGFISSSGTDTYVMTRFTIGQDDVTNADDISMFQSADIVANGQIVPTTAAANPKQEIGRTELTKLIVHAVTNSTLSLNLELE